jgi:hypothetical protein
MMEFCPKSYDGVLARRVMMEFLIFQAIFEEPHHNSVGIEIQAEHSESNLYIFKIDNAAY